MYFLGDHNTQSQTQLFDTGISRCFWMLRKETHVLFQAIFFVLLLLEQSLDFFSFLIENDNGGNSKLHMIENSGNISKISLRNIKGRYEDLFY